MSSVIPPVVGLPLGVVAGTLATLAMDWVTLRISEGTTPPRVASGVLTDTHPDDAPERLAAVIHYLAGAGTGVLFYWLVTLPAAVVGVGLPVVRSLAAGPVLFLLMYGFFAWIVLPRSPLSVTRSQRVARAWAISAAVYVATLVPLFALATLYATPPGGFAAFG